MATVETHGHVGCDANTFTFSLYQGLVSAGLALAPVAFVFDNSLKTRFPRGVLSQVRIF